jgi:glyoxalase family protein
MAGLEGIHHITAITADAPGTVDVYARVLGLRLVKKTVNFDAPDVYHLYFGDEVGAPGSILTFFEFPDAARGRAGAGMVHTIQWRVPSREALDFWAGRLADHGLEPARSDGALRFADPEGLVHELLAVQVDDPPLVARADAIPPEHALQGLHGARAYAAEPARSRALLADHLAFGEVGGPEAWVVAGRARHARWAYDPPPPAPGRPGAGTVHHIAWASEDADHAHWREQARQAGAHVTPVIDREYFRSVYFREPSGVLFEVATLSPGFAVDEPVEHLGEALKLPRQHEHLRPELERSLTPLINPRAAAARAGA